MKANESRLSIAGKPRKGYTLTLSLFSLYQAKAHYTEVGEIARIDLPRGLVLIDPLLVNSQFSSPYHADSC